MDYPVPLDELIFHFGFLQQIEGCLDQLDPAVVEPLNAARAGMLQLVSHVPTTPELAEAWKAIIPAALKSGLVECPQPKEPRRAAPEPRYEPEAGEEPLRVGWDRFPIYERDPLCDAHLLLDECLTEYAGASDRGSDIKKKGAFKKVLGSKNELRGRLLCAVVRRWAWVNWQHDDLAERLLFKTRHAVRDALTAIDMLWDPLLERQTAPSPGELCDILNYRVGVYSGIHDGHEWHDVALTKVVERTIDRYGMSDPLREGLRAWHNRMKRDHRRWSVSTEQAERINQAIEKMLGTAPAFPLRQGEAWSDAALEELADLPVEEQAAWSALLEHAGTADGGKPKTKWRDAALPLIETVGATGLAQRTSRWFALSHKPRTQPLPPSRYLMGYDPNLLLNPVNAQCLKGLAWCIGIVEEGGHASALCELALSGLKAVPGRGPRDTKLSNAAVWALSQLPGTDGVAQLSVLKTKVKHKPTLKGIGKAFDTASEREGVARHEIEEVAVPTYGLTGVGVRQQRLGGFTAELAVTGTTTTELRWIKSDGKPQKSVPKAIKEDHPEVLKELKAVAKDIQKLLPAQRDRLDQLHLKQQTWAYSVWAERYLNHPLVGTLGRRLIWTFDHGAEQGQTDVAWLNGGLVDAAGQPVEVDADTTRVSLWHPIGRAESDILAWRGFVEQHEIKQPFKQAHREVYLLTDAERNTNVYSNRYAAHIVKQHQFNALCAVRGWKNQLRLLVDAEYEPATLELPEWGLRAEFWVDGIGDDYGEDTNDIGTFHYLATDQVRFYRVGAAQNYAHAGGGPYGSSGAGPGADNINMPVPLDQIEPLVFSEVMRDADLFVGVASVGNDPQWQDGGHEGRYRDYWESYSFGDLSATATTRKEILQRLVPRLKIADRCSFSDKFLVVRGDVRAYKIHLGSGNILMEPNDRYLCIVPGRGAVKGPAGKVFLPFEGDRTLSIILSKAFLLAEDTKITDATIWSQIGP